MVQVSGSHVNPFHSTIDLSTAEGKKLFLKATQGLEEKYTGSNANLMHFVCQVQDASETFSFSSCTKNISQDGENLDIFQQPGKVKLDSIKTHCNAF